MDTLIARLRAAGYEVRDDAAEERGWLDSNGECPCTAIQCADGNWVNVADDGRIAGTDIYI